MGDYEDKEEQRQISKYRFKDLINLYEAAGICLIKEERLIELARNGFAPHILIDNRHYWFNRREIFTWAKDNLYLHFEGSALPKVMIVRDHAKADPYGMPESLVPMVGKLREFQGDPHGPCVYFLIDNDDVVYVGQSRSLASRIETHQKNKIFNRSVYLPCPEENLNDVESSLIRKLRPKYNLSQVSGALLDVHKNSLNKIGMSEGEQSESFIS